MKNRKPYKEYEYRFPSGYTPEEGRRKSINECYTIYKGDTPLALSYGESAYEALGAYIAETVKGYRIEKGNNL